MDYCFLYRFPLYLLSNANFSGSRVSPLLRCLFHDNLKWGWGGMSGKTKRKVCPKVKLNIYGVWVCALGRMCWHVCCLTLAVTCSTRAFGTDQVSHPVQWFSITLPQDTCDVGVYFCFICSQRVISLSYFSFLSYPVFAPSTGAACACSLTVLSTDCRHVCEAVNQLHCDK